MSSSHQTTNTTNPIYPTSAWTFSSVPISTDSGSARFGEVVDAQVMRGAAETLKGTGSSLSPHSVHSHRHQRWMVAISGSESAGALQRVFELAKPTDEIVLAHVSPNRPPPHIRSYDSDRIHHVMRVRQADLARSSHVMHEALQQCQNHSKFCHPLALVNPADSKEAVTATLAREAKRIGIDRMVASDHRSQILELDLSKGGANLEMFGASWQANQEARDFKHAVEDIDAVTLETYYPEGG